MESVWMGLIQRCLTALTATLPIGYLMIFEEISIVFFIYILETKCLFLLLYKKLADYDNVISHTKCDVIRCEIVSSYEKNTSKARLVGCI